MNNTPSKLHVLFPMAGEGIRFGGTFKPFLDATEKKFIELAKEPFDKLKPYYDVIYIFIYTHEQEELYNVANNLNKMFPNDNIIKHILNSKTCGPFETIQRAINSLQLSGPCFTCDCDHSIPVYDMYPLIKLDKHDIIIPTFKYKKSDFAQWGKVKLDHSGNILNFYEKEYVPYSTEYKVFGLIGCYYWKDISILSTLPASANLSEAFTILKDIKYNFINIQNAEFFGTPDKLIEFRFNRARKVTLLVDIDGTLIYLPKDVPYNPSEVKLLPGSIEKLNYWKSLGHKIILITGRETARRDKLEHMLNTLQVPYDELITGTHSGTRIVINDKKPYCPFHKMAQAIQLPRNKGIGDICLEPTPNIIKVLKGASFATVFLIEKMDKLCVRKYIEKNKETYIHYETLLRQVEDLKRFAYLSPGSVPTILNIYDSDDEFYFDLEYLEGYLELSKLDNSKISTYCKTLIKRLNTDIYAFKKRIDGQIWLKNFLNEKIYSKFDSIAKMHPSLDYIINTPIININGINVKGINEFFKTENVKIYAPSHVSPIHGDLTLENILVNETTGDVKMIDQSGSRYVDPKEFDIAKMLQSLLAKYETWDNYDSLFTFTNNSFTIHSDFNLDYSDAIEDIVKEFITDEDDVYIIKRGKFYLSMYFIRMIPFMIRHSSERAIFTLLLSTYYLSSL